jgi:PAS domain-containing protein
VPRSTKGPRGVAAGLPAAADAEAPGGSPDSERARAPREPGQRAHRAPPGRVGRMADAREGLHQQKLAAQTPVLDAPKHGWDVVPEASPRARRRRRPAPLARAHHRGETLEKLFEGADAACSHTRVALDYLRCTTEACQYQIYGIDTDSVMACSAAWLETCGYGEEDVVGRNFRHLQGPRTDPNEIRRVAASMAAGEPCYCTFVNYGADGSVWENDFDLVPIRRDDNNEPTHWLSVHGDASALHWSARSSPSTEHRAVSLSDRSRSKSSSDVSSDDPPRARSRSGSPRARRTR